jgi:hypothetical protein
MYNSGDSVFAYFRTTGLYHTGTVVNNDGGNYHVVFEDGDQLNSLSDSDLKPFAIQEGAKVLAMWTDKRFYAGTVAKITGRAFYIHFDDGDKGWTPLAGIALKR